MSNSSSSSSDDRSEPSDPSDSVPRRRRLRVSGGYRQLRSFQVATLIYDGTVFFCDRFIDRHSRTHDQMVQAARSGRQNIAEGNRAGATSSKSEIFLTNVARASLEELLLDYEDFLRHRRLPQWTKDSPEARAIRSIAWHKKDRSDRSDPSDPTDPSTPGDYARWALYALWLEHEEAVVRANALLCLIHQANYLLDQQLIALEQEFVEGGGYSEQLAAARIAERQRQKKDRPDRSDPTDQTHPTDHHFPTCPLCGKLMALRKARQGKNSGSQFWGCTAYPDCKGTLPIEGTGPSAPPHP